MKKSLSALVLSACCATPLFAQVTSVSLSNYQRVGRYALPDPSNTALPTGTPVHNLLAQEASGVAYNHDTDTLFIIGDGSRSITQVSKTGQLIDTMTLPLQAGQPQGTRFYDTEGLVYIGNNQFVFTEERDAEATLVTYTAGTEYDGNLAKTVKLNPVGLGNSGLEGLSYDPATGGYLVTKEEAPRGIFQTNIDFNAGTSTNGNSTTAFNNLFNPSFAGLSDHADVFALSNIIPNSSDDYGNLLMISQVDAAIVEVDRSGNVLSRLDITADPGDVILPADMQHEGLTMDRNGFLYVVNENGGGNINNPQLWVYAPVPEPTTLSLVALGAGALLARRRA